MISPGFASSVDGGIEIRIKVVPGSSRSELAGPVGDRLKVRVTAPPERGKANRAVVALLKDWLGVKDVQIVAGATRAEKTVRIRGLREIPEERLAEIAGARNLSS